MKNLLDGLFRSLWESAIQLLLIAALFAVINYIAYERMLRIDLTDDQQYTLSENTMEVLGQLDKPVHITAYFSDDLPPDFEQARREFQHLISDLSRSSDHQIRFAINDPSGDDDAEEQAEQAGIHPVTLDVRQQDRMTQQRVFLGATMEYGEQMEVMPFMRPGMPMEYEIVAALNRMINPVRPVVGLVQGHGQPGRHEMVQLVNQLEYQYRVMDITNLESGVPEEVDVLAIIAPQAELSLDEQHQIRRYLQEGGRAFFALNRLEVNPQDGSESIVKTGLEDLLMEFGVAVDSTLIIDRNSSSVRVPGQAGQHGYANLVDYPMIPVIQQFADHPVTSGLSSVVFQFLSPVDIVNPPDHFTVEELAWSSEESGLIKNDFNPDPMQEWSGADFLEAYLPAAVSAHGNIDGSPNNPESAIVVVGDGNFLINGRGGNEQELPADNIHFALNAIDWLADDTGLVELRTKITQSRPLQSTDDNERSLIAYGNVLFPILLISVFGLIRFIKMRRKSQQNKDIWTTYEQSY